MDSADLSDQFRVFADALEALGRADGEIVDTSLHADTLAADGPLAADVTVEFSLPGVSDAPDGVDVAIRDVGQTDDGSIAVTYRADLSFGVEVADATGAVAGGDGSAADPDGLDRPGAGRDDEPDRRGEAGPADEHGPGGRDEGLPPYRDPERLRAAYDEHDTFAAMTEALGVDVTPQTVRRYMVEFGIHVPRTRASDRLAGAGRNGSSAVAEEGGTSERHDDPGTDERGRVESDEAAEPSEGEGAGSADAPESNGDATAVRETPETNGAAPADGPASGRLPADAVDRVLTEELDLPERVTLVELTRAVKTARTIHEVAGQLDVDRDRARRALTALDLLPLVTGRLADADRPVTDDEVEARIRGALEGATQDATS